MHGGPVPCATPIAVFEHSWVLSTLARAGVPFTAPPDMVRSLVAALGPGGAAAGPGLPADADTTSVTLYALALLGAAPEPDSLWTYRVESHFCTWPGEDGVSVTTNAHVLDALAHLPMTRPEPVERLSHWLCDQQGADGAWTDRWHASPLYATWCCVLALDGFGATARAADAVDRAVRWVLANQRPDGSWGRWSGTREETAYALYVLLGRRQPPDRRVGHAAESGCRYLLEAAAEPGPALWHDKDLYRPAAIVDAVTVAALHLMRRRRSS
jgi:hypothetical protein